jgi:hypothetical protein
MLLDVTDSTGFAHEDLGLEETWYYRVRAVDASGNPGAPSAPVSAKTGRVLGIEAESLLPAVAASAGVYLQNNCCGMVWSGDAELWFGAGAAGDDFTVRFEAPLDGTYDLSAFYTQAPNFGIITLALDGREIGASFNGYHAAFLSIAPAVDYGSFALSEGAHTLTWKVIDREPSSSGFAAGIDALRLSLLR